MQIAIEINEQLKAFFSCILQEKVKTVFVSNNHFNWNLQNKKGFQEGRVKVFGSGEDTFICFD